jgi:type I restriction enzyme R subunit
MSREMSEDRLVQENTANFFRDDLKWDSVFAYNDEAFGPTGTLGRMSDRDIYLVRYIREALEKFNSKLPSIAYETAVKQILEISVSKSLTSTNKEKYLLFKTGVLVEYRNDHGELESRRLKVFDFETPDNNYFLIVRELWVNQLPYRRRPDLVGFVNGIPLLFIELKNIHKDIRRAYDENLKDYFDTIPHMFDSNALILLSNGDEALVGTITSKFGHFHQWKRLEEEDKGVIDLVTLLKGMFTKERFMDIFENFILFDASYGKTAKILAHNHQYLGVNRAIEAVRTRETRAGRLGVFWHTQGSGKSYSMIFFSEKVRRKLNGNFTFLVVTDRDDLDTQIYKTYAGCGIVDNDRDHCRASSGENLAEVLSQDKPYVFTMIHKFNQKVIYTKRDDIIVISDEAHRTQYGRLALNMRDGLPNAHYIGFTGTPLFSNDELTKRIFGGYVSKYDFQRAVDDNATVPLYYDNRGEKLGIMTTEINERIAQKLAELDLEEDKRARLEDDLGRDYHILTAAKRIDAIARDFVEHYSTSWECGKAMYVAIDKVTAVKMFNLVQEYWKKRIIELEAKAARALDEQEEAKIRKQIGWMRETIMAVVVSEEQGEVERFRNWGMDILPHRTRMKLGFETPDGKSVDIETAFKDADHPFRVVFVCAMWLTGFDVPSLSNMYLDKPVKAHTLMQTIARANRVYEGKNNGLIVDYCGILKNLREALATYAIGPSTGGEEGGENPVKPEEELLEELGEAIDLTVAFLKQQGFELRDLIEAEGFDRNAAIIRAKEAVNQNEEIRKHYEILTREIFRKFKACLTIKGIVKYRPDHDAIEIIYKKLQGDKLKADISDVIKELHEIIDQSISPVLYSIPADSGKKFDISKIDFEKLKKEFTRVPQKNTVMMSLVEQVACRLGRMIKQNPLRRNFQQEYQRIIDEYNREKDRVTIEESFAELIKFISELSEEEQRAVREGLDDESLALYDILVQKKDGFSAAERNRIKKVASDLLTRLKQEKIGAMYRWYERENTKAEVKAFIHDFLWDEKMGLPIESYSPDEVEEKTEEVFEHVVHQYSNE